MLENLPVTTVEAMLDTLPIDLTFMDAGNRIRWFSAHRIFNRPPECLGQNVRECHQESSWPAIDRMVADFKSGACDLEEHVIDKSDGRKIRILYLAVRDASQQYLGLVEMAEEIEKT
ncbi:PAS domain-containing protein [Dehalogenimonas sp. THU2]|uniref:PAS domain-containing protein n=1 Tax=Dehalogenimonas sp. THU2 TaxID=3151121 RepID=UPI003218BC18